MIVIVIVIIVIVIMIITIIITLVSCGQMGSALMGPPQN